MAKSLPKDLQTRVDALRSTSAEAKEVIDALLAHYTGETVEQDVSKVLEGATVYENMSLILPERRKVQLGLKPSGLAVVVGTSVLVSGTWKEYDLALSLSIPGRPKPTWNLVLTNSTGNGPWLVLTLQDQTADKFLPGAKPVSIRNVLLSHLAKITHEVVDEYLLAVNAHAGSKEGILYFLEDYLLYGFRKPLMLFPLTEIKSFSYTVVTRLTFNVVIKLVDGSEHEYGMISHDDYEGINNYVTSKGLNNESLAEERRAKKARIEPSALSEAQEAGQNVDQDDEEEDGPDFEDGSSGSDGDSEDGEDAEDADSDGEDLDSDEQDDEDEEDDEEEELGSDEAEESDS